MPVHVGVPLLRVDDYSSANKGSRSSSHPGAKTKFSVCSAPSVCSSNGTQPTTGVQVPATLTLPQGTVDAQLTLPTVSRLAHMTSRVPLARTFYSSATLYADGQRMEAQTHYSASGNLMPHVATVPLTTKEPEHDHEDDSSSEGLSPYEQYRYDLSRAQLKATSNTSALLAGFAMVALVELHYEPTTPKPLLILLGVVTTLLVSVHLIALMISTCLLPYIDAKGPGDASPHIRLRFYIELSWLFSTCIGLILFLLEIMVIIVVKFNVVGYDFASYIMIGMLIPVLFCLIAFSCLIHRTRFTHSINRMRDKVADLEKFMEEVSPIKRLSMSARGRRTEENV